MFSSENKNNNIENSLILSTNIKKDENKNKNSIFDSNNTSDITPRVNRENKTNIQALKRIENIIQTNIKKLNDNSSFKTGIKSSNIILEKKNINKTFGKKQSNNNIFTYSKEEKYSLLKIKKIKSNKFSPYKSTNHLYNNVENIYDEKEKNDNDTKNLFFKLNKNKKIYSLRKAYMSFISFKDEKGNNKEFKLFRDSDIGLSDGYKIKRLLSDDDIDSDDETINCGVNKCNQNITTAIELMKKKNEEYVRKYLEHIRDDFF